jgi:hypothetical protein
LLDNELLRHALAEAQASEHPALFAPFSTTAPGSNVTATGLLPTLAWIRGSGALVREMSV